MTAIMPFAATPTLTPRDQAAMILDGDREALAELRAKHPRTGRVVQHWYRHDELDDLERCAAALAPSLDTWIGGAARRRRGGTKDDVAFAATAWGDADTAAAREALARIEPAPTLVVRSSTLAEEGERRQGWWKLDRRLGVEEIEPLLRGIAAALGGDSSVCDASRVMRVIGGTNHKRSAKEPIEAITFSGEVHSADALLEALPPPEPDVGAEAAPRAGAGIQATPAGLVPRGQRHQHLYDLSLRLARAGIVDYGRMLAHLVCEYEQFCVTDPPREPGGLEQLARWATTRTKIAARERDRAAREADGSWWAGCVMRGGGDE